MLKQIQVRSLASGAVAFLEGRVTFRLVQVADARSVLELVEWDTFFELLVLLVLF